MNVVTSAAYTASSGAAGGPTIGDLTKPKGNVELQLVIDVTSLNAGTPSIIVKIQGKDPTSGKYYDILTSASIASTGTTVMRVGRGLTPAANATVNDTIPGIFTVTVTNADAQPITYSIGAQFG